MGAEVEHGICSVILAEPPIISRENMSRCEPSLEQKSHGVTFVAHRRLHTDKDIAERFTENKQLTPIGPVLARRRPPLSFDFLEIRLACDVIID